MDRISLTAFCFTLLLRPNGILSASCQFTAELVPGQEYYIYNPQYPNFYGRGTNCIWDVRTVAGSKVFLSCNDFQLPLTENCRGDKLSVAENGNIAFFGAKNYCGASTFSLYSTDARMAIRLQTTFNTPGGRFLCSVTATKTNTPDLDSSESSNRIRPSCDCGWKQLQRIVGGVETGIHEFPYMAALIFRKAIFCGSTLISDRFALTAAHCVYNRNYEDFRLLVGDHDLSTGNDTSTSALYNIDAFEIYPGYIPSTQKNDIAILRTATQILFSPYIGPCCLPFRNTYDSFDGQPVDIIGWGVTEFSGAPSNTLQKAQVNVISRETCESLQSESILNGDICTYSDEDKDTCQYDSGGPILWFDTTIQRYKIIGVTSHGLGCAAGVPGINTRVTEYLQWIIDRTSISFCVK